MITLPSPRDNQIIAQAISRGEYRTREVLKIGGEDWSAAILNATWGPGDIPITLDSVLAEKLPYRLIGEPVELYSEVEGILVPQLLIPPHVGGLSGPNSDGETSGPTRAGGTTRAASSSASGASDPDTTQFQAFSVGAYFNREDGAKFRFFKEYPGNTPEFVVRDLAFRLPYNKSYIKIQPVGTPILYFVEAIDNSGFKPWEKLGEGLNRVAEQVPYLFRDTALAGFDASIDIPLGTVTEDAPLYRAEDLDGWEPPVESHIQYAFVVVYRQDEEGEHVFEPRYAEVPHHGRRTKPWFGSELWIPLDDESDGAEENARQLAYDEAMRMGRGLMGGKEFSLPIHDPRYERGDVCFVHGMERDADGTWERVWQYKVLNFEQEDDGRGIGTNISGYNATVYDESRVEVPTLIVPAEVSPGVVATTNPSFGSSAGWFWLNTDYEYFRHDESGFYVNPEESGGRVRHDANGFWFNF